MNILLIGASSAIATAVARRYAAHQSGLFLIARDGSRLAPQKEDLKIRGAARVGTHELDLLISEEHEAAINAAIKFFHEDDIDLVLICHGSLPDQEAAEDFERTDVKLTSMASVISLLTVWHLTLKARSRVAGGGHLSRWRPWQQPILFTAQPTGVNLPGGSAEALISASTYWTSDQGWWIHR